MSRWEREYGPFGDSFYCLDATFSFFSFSFCLGVLQLFSSFVVGELKISKSRKIFLLSSTIFVLNVYPSI